MQARRRQVPTVAWPIVAWLAGLLCAMQVTAGQDALGATAALASLVACAVCAVAARIPPSGQPVRVPAERALDRLHGRFQQHSRPGVPGRMRARAPGR